PQLTSAAATPEASAAESPGGGASVYVRNVCSRRSMSFFPYRASRTVGATVSTNKIVGAVAAVCPTGLAAVTDQECGPSASTDGTTVDVACVWPIWFPSNVTE